MNYRLRADSLPFWDDVDGTLHAGGTLIGRGTRGSGRFFPSSMD
jgi:hypothetical protein